MQTDLASLLERDHDELTFALKTLHRNEAGIDQLDALDGVRIGFASHVHAESSTLRCLLDEHHLPTELRAIALRINSAHAVQGRALVALLAAPLGDTRSRDRALHLQELIFQHAEHDVRDLDGRLVEYATKQQCQALAERYVKARFLAITLSTPLLSPEGAPQSRV